MHYITWFPIVVHHFLCHLFSLNSFIFLFFQSPIWYHSNYNGQFPIIPTMYNLSSFTFISLKVFIEDQNAVCAPTDVPSHTDCKVHKTCLAWLKDWQNDKNIWIWPSAMAVLLTQKNYHYCPASNYMEILIKNIRFSNKANVKKKRTSWAEQSHTRNLLQDLLRSFPRRSPIFQISGCWDIQL